VILLAVATCLKRSDGRDVDYVIGDGTAREIAARPRQPLNDGSYRTRMREPLHQLVRDVAGIQRWED
jgi:hypothetical protein